MSLRAWSRRTGIILSAGLLAVFGMAAPGRASEWINYQIANNYCSATQSSPISGVYWQVCSYYNGEGYSWAEVLITNSTGNNHYVQADVDLYVAGRLEIADACGTRLMQSHSRLSCSSVWSLIGCGDPQFHYQQGHGRMAIAGRWDGWSWAKTMPARCS
jgi:hypothetical protein